LLTILSEMPTRHERHNRPRAGQQFGLFRVVLAALTIVAGAVLTAVPAAIATTPVHKHHRRHQANKARRQARAGEPTCAGANEAVGGASPAVLRDAVVCLLNQQRALHHLPPLHASPLLDRSAQGWTDTMVSIDQFTHGTNFAARISAAGYVWRDAGENIATGYATPRAVVRAWMASTGHCQNILNPTYRNVGTGLSRRPVSGWANGIGTWTQDFALGMNQSPPSANFAPANGCPY
jgi:uncharacterized protein YkwD